MQILPGFSPKEKDLVSSLIRYQSTDRVIAAQVNEIDILRLDNPH